MKLSIVFVLAALAAACGSSVPPPTERLASSEAAARTARELGAANDPQAALHLRLAEEQIQSGRHLMNEKENKRADLVLQRATSDAELAVMITKEKTLEAQAQSSAAIVQKAKQGQPAQPATPPATTPAPQPAP